MAHIFRTRTEDEMLARLAKRYAPPTYAFFPQVPERVGGGGRTIDAVVMGCWQSTGLEVQGFEVKVHRGDWLREIKQPDKSDSIMRYCDRWWIATGDASVIHTGELPPGWGHLTLHAGHWRVLHVAPKLKPQPLTRVFLAGLLRKLDRQSLEQAKITAEVTRRVEQKRIDTAGELAVIRGKVARFQAASGVDLEKDWDLGRIGEAVKIVLAGALIEREARLRYIAREAARLGKSLTDTAAEITKTMPARAEEAE